MEALIGLVARQRGFINHLFGDALAGKAAQRFLLSLPRRHPLLLIEQVRMAQAEGVAGRRSPAPADDLHHGVGRPAAGDRRQWSPARLAARTGRPFSQIDNPEAARQRLVWACAACAPPTSRKEKRHETTHRHHPYGSSAAGRSRW